MPYREEISVKSLKKSKQYSENDEAQSAVSVKAVKPKAKPKHYKSGLKDMDLSDDVYAPGFRLRSKKTEVVKTKPNRILKQVKYSGMEPKVKLPWPVSKFYLQLIFGNSNSHGKLKFVELWIVRVIVQQCFLFTNK